MENRDVTTNEMGSEICLQAADLIAAVSYMTDVYPKGCYYHNWRVGLVARRIAAMLDPEKQDDVFYAGLFEDIGVVGADKHIIYYPTLREQFSNRHIVTHPFRSSALVDWLQWLNTPSYLIKFHHEWLDGSGYPDRKSSNQIPLGSQILALVDAADIAGCFRVEGETFTLLESLRPFVGRAWSENIWDALWATLEDEYFCNSIINEWGLPRVMEEAVSEIGVPKGLDSEEGVERLLHLIAMLVDSKDPSTRGHSMRTAKYAKILATTMNFSDIEAHVAYRAGLVHDVGRMGLPTLTLGKATGLRPDEMEMVRKHPEMTIQILNCIPRKAAMKRLSTIAGHDHERWDGTGYPHRLAGNNIPVISRILAAADAYDVVTSPQSYKQPLSPRAALGRLKLDVRSQFDPDVIEALEIAVNAGSMAEVARLAA